LVDPISDTYKAVESFNDIGASVVVYWIGRLRIVERQFRCKFTAQQRQEEVQQLAVTVKDIKIE
jgi:hypothetical protein